VGIYSGPCITHTPNAKDVGIAVLDTQALLTESVREHVIGILHLGKDLLVSVPGSFLVAGWKRDYRNRPIELKFEEFREQATGVFWGKGG
jgi:hypothetical protein